MKNNYVLRHNLTYYLAKLPYMCKVKHNWSIIGRNKLIENQEICSWSTKKNFLKLSAYQSGPKGTIEIIGIATFKKYQNDTTLVKLQIGLGKLFIIQEGGLLNAFAIRFSGSNYIAIYSDVFEMIEHDIDILKFIIGHELGHIKRMHMSKRFWTILSSIIPFLSAAYSRSCEFTCDNIGFSVTRADSKRALLLLAAGKKLYKQVDPNTYLVDAKINNTLSVKIMELFMSHPYLPKRIKNIEKIMKEEV